MKLKGDVEITETLARMLLATAGHYHLSLTAGEIIIDFTGAGDHALVIAPDGEDGFAYSLRPVQL